MSHPDLMEVQGPDDADSGPRRPHSQSRRRPQSQSRPRPPAGYPHGPGAPERATARALDLVGDATEAVILVEGVTDQIAVETLARRRSRDLAAEGVVILPVGGAQAVGRFVADLGPGGRGLDVAGLCDADAAETVRRAVDRSEIGPVPTVGDLARIGFHVCVEDLEDELIRAVGSERVLIIVEAQGELGSFHTLQRQPEWRGRPVEQQLRRFIQAKARRGQRYAELLVDAVELQRAPWPMEAVLAWI